MNKKTLISIGIAVLSVVTALIHLSLFPDIMFTLNGLGYLGLAAALLLPIPFLARFKKPIWWLFFGYTLLTMLLWVIMGEKTFVAGTSSALGYYATVTELILAVLLWFDKP
jgi:hypothetical protein